MSPSDLSTPVLVAPATAVPPADAAPSPLHEDSAPRGVSFLARWIARSRTADPGSRPTSRNNPAERTQPSPSESRVTRRDDRERDSNAALPESEEQRNRTDSPSESNNSETPLIAGAPARDSQPASPTAESLTSNEGDVPLPVEAIPGAPPAGLVLSGIEWASTDARETNAVAASLADDVQQLLAVWENASATEDRSPETLDDTAAPALESLATQRSDDGQSVLPTEVDSIESPREAGDTDAPDATTPTDSLPSDDADAIPFGSFDSADPRVTDCGDVSRGEPATLGLVRSISSNPEEVKIRVENVTDAATTDIEPSDSEPRSTRASRGEAQQTHHGDETPTPTAAAPPASLVDAGEVAPGHRAESENIAVSAPSSTGNAGTLPTTPPYHRDDSAESVMSSAGRTMVREGATTSSAASVRESPTTRQTEFAERLARAIDSCQPPSSGLRVRLHPPSLGSLQIDVRLEDGALTARFGVDNVQADQLLRGTLPMLRDSLARIGAAVERIDIQLSSARPAETQPSSETNRESPNGQSHSGNGQSSDSGSHPRRQDREQANDPARQTEESGDAESRQSPANPSTPDTLALDRIDLVM